MKEKALVTLVIGDDYADAWNRFFKRSWEEYADIHDYDIVVIDDFIDNSDLAKSRSVHWQKCLILEDERVRKYKNVVWLDSDVLVNFHSAPCIVEANASDNIGVVSYGQIFNNQRMVDNLVNRFGVYYDILKYNNTWLSPLERYKKCGFKEKVTDGCNTGVLVLKPNLHTDVLRYIYENYEESEFSAKDETCVSYHIFKEGLANHLDERFNMLLPDIIMENYSFLYNKITNKNRALASYCINAAWLNSYFLHFIIAQGTINHVVLVNQESKDPFFYIEPK